MPNDITKLTIVGPNEVRVTLDDGQERQKLVSGGNRHDAHKYFKLENLMEIGAFLWQVDEHCNDYPRDCGRLFDALMFRKPGNEKPDRDRLAGAINGILAKWNKDCVDCDKPFSNQVLHDPKYLEIVKRLERRKSK